MVGRHNENEFVEVNHDRMQAWFLRFVRENSEFGSVAQDVVRYVTAQRTLDRDLDHGMQPPEFRQDGEQIQRSELVGGDHQFSLLQLAQFGERFGGFLAQID